MICTFGDEDTEDIFNGLSSKSARKTLPVELHKTAVRKLDLLNHARSIEVMNSPPGNRLEALRGDLVGFWSIRINDQFRIIFEWRKDNAWEVKIVDYH